jgi:prepilin-type processing-associated H-X9-DG protein
MYSADFTGAIPPSYPTTEQEVQQSNNFLDVIWISRVAPYYQKSGDFSSTGFKRTCYNTPYFRCPTQKYYLKLILDNKAGTGLYSSPKTGKKVALYAAGGTYGMNWYFSGLDAVKGNNTYNFRRFDQVKNGSAPLLSDTAAEPYYEFSGTLQSPWNRIDIGGWFMRPLNPHASARRYGWNGGDDMYGPAPVHSGKINYAFVDGHVESKKMWPWDNSTYEKAGDRLHLFHPLGAAGVPVP